MDHHAATDAKTAKTSKKWIRLIRPTLLLLTTTILFVYVSYSWMRREWTPYIEQSGITIATGGSLVFEFEDSATPSTGKSINEVLGLDKDFVLKPVSNLYATPEGFFALDLQRGKGLETYKHLDPASYKDGSQMGIANGYVEFQMMLLSPDSEQNTAKRYVYIHPESKIKFGGGMDTQQNVEKCIRIAITHEGTGETWIFGVDGALEHTGVNPKLNADGTYLMDGVKYYSADGKTPATAVGSESIVQSTAIRKLSDFNGGTYDESGKVMTEKNTEKTLFELLPGGSSTGSWITIRIWAEGTNENCTDIISGAKVDIKLKFSSYTVAQ